MFIVLCTQGCFKECSAFPGLWFWFWFWMSTEHFPPWDPFNLFQRSRITRCSQPSRQRRAVEILCTPKISFYGEEYKSLLGSVPRASPKAIQTSQKCCSGKDKLPSYWGDRCRTTQTVLGVKHPRVVMLQCPTVAACLSRPPNGPSLEEKLHLSLLKVGEEEIQL